MSSMVWERSPPGMTSRRLLASDGNASKINVRVLILCLAISGGTIVVLVVISLIVYFWFVRFRASKTIPFDGTQSGDVVVPLRRFTYREIRSATGGFGPVNELGRGGSGTVYRGDLPCGKSVAVKKLDHLSMQAEREFQNELQILGNLRSPYVVNLLGYCTDQEKRILVYEFMPNRSLQEVLFSQDQSKKLRWNERFKIILCIAKALAFLHLESDPPVIHGDIKPSNVLLGADFSAKLSDFGISRVKLEGDVNGFDLFSQELWKSQELEKNSAMNSEVDFALALQNIKSDFSGKLADENPNTSYSKGKEISIDHEGDHREIPLSDEDSGFELVPSPPDLDGNKDWWWRQDGIGELQAKDYVMEWIGSQICTTENHHIHGDGAETEIGSNLPNSETAKELETVTEEERRTTTIPKPRKMKEWWKEEYFAEINDKSNNNNNNDDRFKKLEDKLIKRFRSAKQWKRQPSESLHDFYDHQSNFEASFRRGRRKRKKSQLPTDPWSGDLFSRELSSTTSMRGTICYVAPEYGGCGCVSDKGDVYSFGVLVLVIVSGRRPLHILSSPMKLEKANLVNWSRQLAAQNGNLLELVDEALKNEYDKIQANLCIHLALLCLQKSPELRPEIEDMVKMLSGEMEIPPLPAELTSPPPPKSTSKSRRRMVVDGD